MLGVLLLVLIQASPASAAPTDAAIEQYRALTMAGPRCAASTDPDEIQVCDRRRADNFRVPLIEPDPGDPKNEGVPAERERLLARSNNCAEKSSFLVGCGMAGVTVGTRGVQLGGERPIAP
ncbi:MAG: hypothetical protein V4564_15810 [Pseudomonadota bacterium]|uniref:hypothetical protein n=1 Tax=Sphingomonas sp. ERG5 TaxID=1381597 RepID=UPI00054C7F77|nr:hypothetical protein [Sphingomonas sp. ERG5]